jgi:3-hydroxy-9,10-secoandrosta-1,3,5(10)-triene-9,17-dione monooxygenase reductase component
MPVGMVVGSFTSVSLDPPLVAFFPDRKSTSWPRIERSGRFCVNVLADGQHDVCRALASKAENKFENVAHRMSAAGLPIIEGSVAWIDCDLHAVHEAGDHFIAIGKVHSLDAVHGSRPLLFFQGGYGQFSPFAAATA